MKSFIKTYWKTIMFFAVIGLVGGFFTGLYALNSYPVEIQQELVEEMNNIGLTQIPADVFIALVTAVQSFGYGVLFGFLGIWLGKKTRLWKDERTITKKPLTVSLIWAIVGGIAMILPDLLFFGNYSDVIMDSYAAKPTVAYILASVTYGAVIEEVFLRLFAMSLVAFVLHKLFAKKNANPTTAVLIASNVIAAVLFAAGHLPLTVETIGASPIIIFRCFLLNGGLGLIFGYLYRKFGLRYAMLAHGGCHIVSKLIWILFI